MLTLFPLIWHLNENGNATRENGLRLPARSSLISQNVD